MSWLGGVEDECLAFKSDYLDMVIIKQVASCQNVPLLSKSNIWFDNLMQT